MVVIRKAEDVLKFVISAINQKEQDYSFEYKENSAVAKSDRNNVKIDISDDYFEISYENLSDYKFKTISLGKINKIKYD